VEEDQKKNYDVVRQIAFLFFLIVSICSACLLSLLTPFVTDFWLNDNYSLSLPIVVFCVINFSLAAMGFPIGTIMNATGLFKKERNLAVIVAIVNLILSLALVKPLGIVGVQLGTAAAYLTEISYRTRVFFKDYLKMSVARYIKELIQYGILIILETTVAYIIVNSFYKPGSFLHFIVAGVVCVLVPCSINILLYCRSWRLRSILNMVMELIGGKKSWTKQ